MTDEISCPRCGAPNRAYREWCHACGDALVFEPGPYWWRDGPGLPTRDPVPEDPHEVLQREIKSHRERGAFPPGVKQLETFED